MVGPAPRGVAYAGGAQAADNRCGWGASGRQGSLLAGAGRGLGLLKFAARPPPLPRSAAKWRPTRPMRDAL